MTKRKQQRKAPELNNAEKKRLRSLGHHLSPVILIGKEGMSASLLAATDAALDDHELIKVRLGQNAPLEREEAAPMLAQAAAAALVQRIGRVFLLYRPNPDLPAARRIDLRDTTR